MSPPPAAELAPSARRTLCALFLSALAIRWAYVIVLFATMGRDGLMQADSYGYVGMAEKFAAGAVSGSLHGWQWLGPDLGVMPLFTWLLSLHVALAASWAPLTYTLSQGVLDAAACLLVYGIADSIGRRFALPAAIAAALNPTQIILSGLVYTDTLFVFFVALSLFAALRWMRAPSWQQAFVLGIGLAGAALSRILMVPWTGVVVFFLLIAVYFSRGLRVSFIGQLAMAAAILCASIAPILSRNVAQYHAWTLTPQGGAHLALWIVPLVKEAYDGTPWLTTADEMTKREQDRFGANTTDPFESSRHYAEIGRQALKDLGLFAMAKAWLVGAAINLGTPAVILSPPVARLPRTGFFGTRGGSPLEKVVNFLFHSDNALYAWLLLIGIAGVSAMRLLQLCGVAAFAADRATWAGVLLLVLWCLFILAVNGPVASPKYRLPMEPALAVFSGAGYLLLRDWFRRLSRRRPQAGFPSAP